MRVVVLTCNDPNQMALCHKLSAICDISAIVLSRNIPVRRKPLADRLRLFRCRIDARLTGKPFVDTWFRLQDLYRQTYPAFPTVPLTFVDNINHDDTSRIIAEHAPDLVVVSGTNLVGKRIIESARRRIGVINLHTGISPYVKGGPNCTNWCLAESWLHLIGNTVMWLDPGIDSGAIIATEQTPLTGDESLLDLHWKVMEHAQAMYVAVVSSLAAGVDLPKVQQATIGEGRTFLSSDWNASAMLRARRNFAQQYNREYFQSAAFAEASRKLQLFPILRGRRG